MLKKIIGSCPKSPPEFIFRCRGDALAVRTGPVLPSAPMQLQGVANRLGAMMGWKPSKNRPKPPPKNVATFNHLNQPQLMFRQFFKGKCKTSQVAMHFFCSFFLFPWIFLDETTPFFLLFVGRSSCWLILDTFLKEKIGRGKEIHKTSFFHHPPSPNWPKKQLKPLAIGWKNNWKKDVLFKGFLLYKNFHQRKTSKITWQTPLN